jgi:hypothetical protein
MLLPNVIALKFIAVNKCLIAAVALRPKLNSNWQQIHEGMCRPVDLSEPSKPSGWQFQSRLLFLKLLQCNALKETMFDSSVIRIFNHASFMETDQNFA